MRFSKSPFRSLVLFVSKKRANCEYALTTVRSTETRLRVIIPSLELTTYSIGWRVQPTLVVKLEIGIFEIGRLNRSGG